MLRNQESGVGKVRERSAVFVDTITITQSGLGVYLPQVTRHRSLVMVLYSQVMVFDMTTQVTQSSRPSFGSRKNGGICRASNAASEGFVKPIHKAR